MFASRRLLLLYIRCIIYNVLINLSEVCLCLCVIALVSLVGCKGGAGRQTSSLPISQSLEVIHRTDFERVDGGSAERSRRMESGRDAVTMDR